MNTKIYRTSAVTLKSIAEGLSSPDTRHHGSWADTVNAAQPGTFASLPVGSSFKWNMSVGVYLNDTGHNDVFVKSGDTLALNTKTKKAVTIGGGNRYKVSDPVLVSTRVVESRKSEEDRLVKLLRPHMPRLEKIYQSTLRSRFCNDEDDALVNASDAAVSLLGIENDPKQSEIVASLLANYSWS